MVKTSRLRVGAVVAISITSMTFSAGCGAVLGEAEPEAVVIGVDVAMSGDDEALGQVYRQAIELWVEQVNEQERLGEDLRLEVELLDNGSDATVSAENLTSLADDPSISAIVTDGCRACLDEQIVGTLVEQTVPTISIGGASNVTGPVEERRPIFKVGPNASDNAALLAATMANADVATIGLVTTDDSYGEEGKAAMRDAAADAGIEIVVERSIPSDGDPAAVAGALAAYQPEEFDEFGQPVEPDGSGGPDAVAVWTPSTLAGELAMALDTANYDKPLYLDAVAAEDVLLVGEPGAALAGATMVFTETLVIDDVIATSPAKVARKSWVRDYTARFGQYDAGASFAADAIEVVVQALNRSEGASQDRELLLSIIEAIQIEGLSGSIQMRPNQHSGLIAQALTVLVARGDRWRPTA